MRTKIYLIDIDEDGFHVAVKGKVNGMKALFLIDTGASRSVFDPVTISRYINDLHLEKKEGMTAGVGGSDLESSTFVIKELQIGRLTINDFEAVALDLSNIKDYYSNLHLPPITGIIGGDILAAHKAIINYKSLTLTIS